MLNRLFVSIFILFVFYIPHISLSQQIIDTTFSTTYTYKYPVSKTGGQINYKTATVRMEVSGSKNVPSGERSNYMITLTTDGPHDFDFTTLVIGADSGVISFYPEDSVKTYLKRVIKRSSAEWELAKKVSLEEYSSKWEQFESGLGLLDERAGFIVKIYRWFADFLVKDYLKQTRDRLPAWAKDNQNETFGLFNVPEGARTSLYTGIRWEVPIGTNKEGKLKFCVIYDLYKGGHPNLENEINVDFEEGLNLANADASQIYLKKNTIKFMPLWEADTISNEGHIFWIREKIGIDLKAFVKLYDAYVRIDGDTIKLSNENESVYKCKLSNDGGYVCYVTRIWNLEYRRYNSNIYGADLKSMEKLKYGTVPGEILDLDISKGIRHIVTSNYVKDEKNTDIYLLDTTGKVSNLTQTPSGIYEASPKFSPDGSKILYLVNGNLCLMNSNGTSNKLLTNDYNIPPRFGCYFTHDGERVMYVQPNKASGSIFSDTIKHCIVELGIGGPHIDYPYPPRKIVEN